MAVSVEDIVNQALVGIGFPERIASINEGSRASIAALEIYGQTRNEVFDAGEWPLARRANIPLVLLKGPPPNGGFNPRTPWSAQYPPSGWLYEYEYPDDMIDLKAVIKRPMAMFDLSPRGAVFRVDNDNSLIDKDGEPTAQKKVILANIPNAVAVYTGVVTDPGLWEPGFTSVLIDKLGQKLSRALGMSENVERAELSQVGMDLPPAEQDRG